MKRFLIALQFLTVLPIKIKSEVKKEDFGKSCVYFPLVGLCIGLFLVLILYLFDFLPGLVTAILILAASIVITGGIHLDGFADTCDGLYGFKTKEKALEIMRDSHIGAMGVIGLTTLLLLKFALIANIPKENLWRILIFMAVFSRWACAYACYSCSSVRKDGKGKNFIDYAENREIFLATIFSLILFLVLMKIAGLLLFIFSYIVMILFINCIKRKIGGMTGDTIGAVNEVAESAALLFGLILSGLLYV